MAKVEVTVPKENFRRATEACSETSRLFRGRWRRRSRRYRQVQLRQFRIDQSSETIERLRSAEEMPVYKERRGAGDAEAVCLLHVRRYFLFDRRTIQVGRELRTVESEVFRILLQIIGHHFLLILKQFIVILPELALVLGGFGCDCSSHRILVNAGERKILPHDLHFVFVNILNLFESRTDSRAERSLKV